MKLFENDLTQTIDAIRANVEQKQALIDKLIEENTELLAACKNAILALNDAQGAPEWTHPLKTVVEEIAALIQKIEGKP